MTILLFKTFARAALPELRRFTTLNYNRDHENEARLKYAN
jgi:hypothetical protein